MPYIYVRQSPKTATLISAGSYRQLLFEVQDMVSIVLDVPMCRVGYKAEFVTVENLGYDLVIAVVATDTQWRKIYNSRSNLQGCVVASLLQHLEGIINETDILVEPRTMVSPFKYAC